MTRPDFRIARSAEEYHEMLAQSMPADPEAERVALGGIFLDNELIWEMRDLGLEATDFYVRKYHITYEVMIELADEGQEITPLTVSNRLTRRGQLDQVGGMMGLAEITFGLPHFTSVKPVVKIIMGQASLRALYKTVQRIAAQIIDADEGPEEILKEAESLVLDTVSEGLRRGSSKGRKKDFMLAREDKHELIEVMDKAHRGEASALATGITPLDNMLEAGGLNKQGLYMVSAEPKAGKTSLALGIAYRAAQRFQQEGEGSVGVISMEMRRLGLVMRLFSAHTQIPYTKLQRPGFRGIDYEKARASVDGFIDGLPLYITDAIFTMPEMWRACERLCFGPAQCKLIVLDYLQLAEIQQGRGLVNLDQETAKVTAVSRESKHMAQEFNVPVLAISSLNRLGQLRQSGQLEYDLEALIQLENPDWRPNMTREEREDLNKRSVWDINANLKYQRNGPTGEVALKFVRPYMQFLTPEEYELTQRAKTPTDPRDIPF